MHNIDRTNLETGYGEFTGEIPGEYTGEYGGEFGGEYGGEFEFQGESETYGEYSQESPFSEAQEMELAAELLSISNEAELEQFFGGLLKKVGRLAGGFIKSPIGQSLVGSLKGLAKQALPALGATAGNMLLPGIGGALGSQLASAAGGMFGLELEGLSQEDQEFEVAKQIVRLAGAAGSNAAQAPPVASTAQAAQAASQALLSAAQSYAPGLIPGTNGSMAPRHHHCAHPRSGRWIRRRNVIILLGA
jgi:hypothetical protein